MCGHPTVGGEQPLCSNANYGPHGECDAKGKNGCCEFRLYQLSNEASGLQHAWDNDGGLARSQVATSLPSRSHNSCLSSDFWHLWRLMVHVISELHRSLFLLYKSFFDSAVSSATRPLGSMRN